MFYHSSLLHPMPLELIQLYWQNRSCKLTGVTDGSVSSNKVLVADENNNLSGLSTVNLTKLSDGAYLEAGVFNNLKSVHVESGNAT